MMAPQSKAKTIFLNALEIPSAAERQAYVAGECGGDEALRQEVEELLQHQPAVGSFLSSPGPRLDGTVDNLPLTERIGTVIGPYKLKELIGEGGMGLVFVAEQQQPVRRKVALKVIKPGMDTRDVIARFEAERQALALMDHPNIARVLDAGATDSGRPYFVMELVRGIPITDYCDQHALTPRERLDLFVHVCQAVQHAHTKGVIHRDLKPSNVLIAPHDGTPVVKVIDFGVAKAVGQPLTDKSIYTRLNQMIGTPLYMSPEQAEINALDVDTRSDVYGLGVLLYELLTGTTPFDRQRLHTAAFDEIRRIIREEEPPRPSTRLTTLGEGLSVMSAKRKTEPSKLSALFQGELDWIVMKALEKDRTRRYETASAMAEDVRRFLNDELVEARPPSAWYRFRKMARRNKAAMTTAALVAATLLLGFVASAWQAVRATRAEDAALVAEARALTAREKEAEQRQAADDQRDQAVAAKAAALAARDEEAQQRKAAVKERNRARAAEVEAETNRQLAEEKAKMAENERQKADLARQEAQINATTAERRLYAFQITSAQRELDNNNVSLFYDFLDQCRQDFRGWEHDYLYTLANQSLQTLRGHKNGVHSVAISPDGKRLASGSFDNTVKLWDAESGQVDFTLGHKNYVNFVGFSPDGKRLVSASDNMIKLWDAASGKEIQPILLGPSGRVTSVAISQNGKHLASASASKTVKLWDAFSGRQLLTLIHGHATAIIVSSVAFSPDGRRLASAANDGTVRLWELASGQEYLTLQGDNKRFTSVVFSPDGKRLAAGSNGFANNLVIWDAASGNELRVLKGHTDDVTSVAFSPDGKRLASASEDNTVRLWDAVTGEQIETLKGHTSYVTSVVFSPDGKRLASASGDSTVKVWDAAGVQNALGVMFRTEKSSFHGIAFSPDGKRLASALQSSTPKSPHELKLWDTASGQEVLTFKGNQGQINSVAFSPDGKRLAGASSKTVKLWDTATGNEILTLQGLTGSVRSVAFSRDGDRLAGAAWDQTVKLWDASSGQEILTLKGHRDTVLSVAFSPDGKCLASASKDNTVKLWDASSGQEIQTLLGHTGRVNSVAFSPDGKCLASASEDKTVRLWDASSGQEIQTLLGHAGGVYSVAFSPDGKRLASASSDQTVRLWDAATGQQVLTLKTNPSFIGGTVVFSPDGKRLAENGGKVSINTGKITIWDASKSAADSSFDLNRLGNALRKKNQLDEAISAYRKAIAIDPKFAHAYLNLGNALRDKNQFAEAIAAYRKAIDIDPRNSKVHNNLAWLLATCADQSLRHPATALASAKKAIELDPAFAQLYQYWTALGAAHYRSGEWKEAIAALDKTVGKAAKKLGRTSADFFFLAMAHWQLGHADQAREWYDKGVQWMTQNRTKDEETQRFRAEAAELLGIPVLDPLSNDMPVPKK